MKTKIHSLTELQSEITRLKELKHSKENKLRADVKSLTQELKPINLVKNLFSSVAGDKDLKTQVAAKGTEAALGFLLTNLIFKNANPFIRTAATIMGTAAASKIFGEETPKYIEKIKGLYEKFKNRKPKDQEMPFNEDDIYK